MSQHENPTITASRPKTTMRGADIVVRALEREGVEVVFAYPGGASMELHQSLTRSKKIRVVLPRHEQGGVFAAEGYARATGRAGVVMATSGPGATNLVTGVADAYMDSVPLVVITGQVPTKMIGRGAFQETDVFGLSAPIVKHSYLVMNTEDIPRIIKEAFYIAQTGRPGPVWIDIPKDVQQGSCVPVFPERVHLRGYNPDRKIDPIAVQEIAGLIEKSERPVIYAGGGIISANASRELIEFVEKTNIPITTTIMGIGAIPADHPLSMRWLGMHGTVTANYAVDKADLLLAFGVRFDDRVTGKVSEFAKHGTIVHIDIDPSEINKNKVAHLPVVSDIKYALQELNKVVKGKEFKAWHAQINEWKQRYPFRYRVTEEVLKSQYVRDFLQGNIHEIIMPQYVIEVLSELTNGEAIITTGVGQHQMWAAQFYRFKHPRTFLTSAGLGAMGYGYPAAMGAKVAHPEREVIDIDGDGSFLMNIQELATAHIEHIAAKAVVLNNQHLGMVVQWEDRFYQSNRAHTYLGDPDNPHQIYPDFVAIAKGFNVPAERIFRKSEVRPALERMLAAKEPYVLDVIVPYTEHVLPMIPSGKTVRDIIIDEPAGADLGGMGGL
ncbi:MAG: biosynthetic-type acetolactate synthase large subunit [Verrucomicrobiae bacterium]|nr:biosynthetic-type acetolactate synthase large subunit [Verrucomicrobiae bacterium]